MKLFGRIMLVFALAVCVMFVHVSDASAFLNFNVYTSAPCHGYGVAARAVAAPVYATPAVYGYPAYTYAAPVMVTYAPRVYAPRVYVAPYPVVYSAPVMMPYGVIY
jgi:hypothetical protein